MTCPNLLSCSRYADGELPADEVTALEAHLKGCDACRSSVERLSADSLALRQAMKSADEAGIIPAFVPRPTLPRLLSWIGWLVLGAWTVSMAWTSLVDAGTMPGWLGWLAPDATGVGTSLLIGLTVGLVTQGSELLSGLMQMVWWAALVTVGAAILWQLNRRGSGPTRTLCLTLTSGFLLSVLAPPGQAFELRRDDDRVTIPAGETIDDTLIVLSETITIEGTVTGDLIALGERVRILGNVGGILFSAAESLEIEGSVGGSVLSMAETVELRQADLAANLFGVGNEVTVHDDVDIAGNALLAGETTEMHGSVGRDLITLAESSTLFGNADGNLRAYGKQVELTDGARVGGDLMAMLQADENLIVADGATVAGSTDLRTWPEEPERYLTVRFYLGRLLQLAAAFIAGMALFKLFPALNQQHPASGGEFLTTAAFGAVALVATPVLALVATMTLIGAPVGITTFLLWLIALYAAGIVTAGLIGRLMLSNETGNQALPLLAGLAVLLVLTSLPFVGGLIRLVVLILGLGLIAQWGRDLWQARQAG